jgi:hypothetical protein
MAFHHHLRGFAMHQVLRLGCTVAVTISASWAMAVAHAAAVVTWASDPVHPDEAVLVRGAGFGTQPTVVFARCADGDPSGPAAAEPTAVTLATLQGSDDALTFIVPAGTQPGVFSCRVVANGAASAALLLNLPQCWWLQGDAGSSATPGGWLRIFGKCLGTIPASVLVVVKDDKGIARALPVAAADDWSLRVPIPADLQPGSYTIRLHNGHGGPGAWSPALAATISASAPWPAAIYDILESAGPDAVRDMRRTLVKYGKPVERTAEVLAALAKAKAGGGGIVYFPAGRYHLNAPLALPPHTVLRGEGMGLVTLWWGNGTFNLDGGGDKGLAKEAEAEPPGSMISGPSFAIEAMSIYLPFAHRTGIDGYGEVRLHQLRVRVDHLWALDGGKRPEGLVARLGHGFEVSDCDIIAKGEALAPGEYGVIARNRIFAGKATCPMGNGRALIVEDNQFTSTYPTAYENIAGVGQDLYYARNRHEALSAHQADFSFTFDAGGSAYRGALAAVDGASLTLAGDPQFPTWANEKSGLWKKAVVCVVSGTGSSQWRAVRGFSGRTWTLSEPFAVAPDAHSMVTIVPLCGRALIVGNRFEDANWVNAGYGCALDVIYAGNQLVRCAEMLDYGLASPEQLLPNFNVQCFDNVLSEGSGSIEVNGSVRPADCFAGQITQNIIHRRERLSDDNSGSVVIQGATREVIIEGLSAGHPQSAIKVEHGASAVLIRQCRSPTGAIRCEGAVQVP